MKTKNRIQTLDFRNAKYYGQVSNQQNISPNGFGMVLDQNFTWIMGTWDHGHLLGDENEKQCFAVFGDSDKMFGFARNNQDKIDIFKHNGNGVTVYESHGYAIYCKGSTIVINFRDCSNQLSNTLFKFSQLNSQSNFVSSISFGLSSRNKRLSQGSDKLYSYSDFQLRYITHRSYSNEKQFISILQDMLQLSLLHSSVIDFQSYLRYSPIFHQHLSLSPTPADQPPQTPISTSTSASHQSSRRSTTSSQIPSQFTISLHSIDSSMTLKFSKQFCNKLDKISFSSTSQLSTFRDQEQLSKTFQYYLNYQNQNKTVQGYFAQQLINTQPQCYIQYKYNYDHMNINQNIQQQENLVSEQSLDLFQNSQDQLQEYVELYGRSNLEVHKRCVKNLQEYYKKSLNFENKFINLSDIYQQRAQFKNIFSMAFEQLCEHLLKKNINNNNKTQIIKQTKNQKQQTSPQKQQKINKYKNNKNNKTQEIQTKETSFEDLQKKISSIQEKKQILSKYHKSEQQLQKQSNSSHQKQLCKNCQNRVEIQVSKWKDPQNDKKTNQPKKNPQPHQTNNNPSLSHFPNNQTNPYISTTNNNNKNSSIGYRSISDIINTKNINTNNYNYNNFAANTPKTTQRIRSNATTYDRIPKIKIQDKYNQLSHNANKFKQQPYEREPQRGTTLDNQIFNNPYQNKQQKITYKSKLDQEDQNHNDSSQQSSQQQQQYYQQQQSQCKPYRKLQPTKTITTQLKNSDIPPPASESKLATLAQILKKQLNINNQINQIIKNYQQISNTINTNSSGHNITKTKDHSAIEPANAQPELFPSQQCQQSHHQSYYPPQLGLNDLTTHYQYIKQTIQHRKKTRRTQPRYQQSILKDKNYNRTQGNRSFFIGDKYHNNIHYYNFGPIKSHSRKRSTSKSLIKNQIKYYGQNKQHIHQTKSMHWPFTDYIEKQTKKLSKIGRVYENLKKINRKYPDKHSQYLK